MKYLLAALSLFLGEAGIKTWVEKKLVLNRERPFFKNNIILTKHHNYGFAHNRYQNRRRLVLSLSVGSFVFLWLNAVRIFFSRCKKGLKLGMIFLLAGGASNAYDRVKRGYVVDYFIINKGWLKRTIFNLADMFLFLGGVICAVTGKKRGEL
jgi:signal peptidase II